MDRTRVCHRCGLAIALSALLFFTPSRASAEAPSPPAGHLRNLAARRVATPPVIDGALVDDVWAQGAVADGFWSSDRQRPPADETRVIVVYDETALYFAFTCLDRAPDRIRATQLARDGAPGLDDRVTVELDPYHNHRSVSRFTVTARGTQSDAIAGGRARQQEWKGTWTAAARRTPEGWTAEIAIPLSMLEFETGTDTFGINFSRFQHRTREWSEWANLTARRLPEETGHLTGLKFETAAPGGLTLMQYVSGGSGTPDAGMATGMDVRYQWRGTMTSVLSAGPDFSATDADVAGIGFSYTEKFLGDRRPFFQEGQSFFGDREIFHSGRIEDFDLGVKTFGRVQDYQIGVLATADARTQRCDYVGRIVREIGPSFNASATLVGTDRPALHNDTIKITAGGRLGRNVQVTGDFGRTIDARPGDATRGRGEVAYHALHWYSGGWVDRAGPAYFPAIGFLASDVIGTKGRGAYAGYSRAFNDEWMRNAEASIAYDVRDTVSGLPQRRTISIYAGAESAANIQVNGGFTFGSYRPTGATPGEWAVTVNDDRYYLASAYYSSPSGTFGCGAQYSGGFVGAYDYASILPSLWVSPSEHLSVAYSFERARHDEVQHQHIVSGTWDISGAQSLAVRWTEYDGGYYRVSYRRAVARSIDAFGVYTSSPYDPAEVNVKLVWTLKPFESR